MISPGLRIGRYEVGKRLGKGGFGVVHIARDVDLDRDVAIKVLRPEYQARPQIVQRFLQEARAAAKIGHPGIVTVFECGQIQGTGTHDDGNAYIAMELLVGQSLADRLLDGGRMSTTHAIEITRQLAAALGAAHAAGIVHRDLKPDNVFLLPDAAVHGGERVKILDFGVAKLMDAGEDGVNTHSQMMLGTPKYMSPEQARSASKADHRSDLYTLGCLLFEMLTGRGPFGGDAGDQMIAHQKSPPPSARAVVGSVPVAVDSLIKRLLAKSPDDRPASANVVVDALTDLGDEPDTVVRAPFHPTPAPLELTPEPRISADITTVAEPVRGRVRRRYDRPTMLIVAAAGLGGVLVSMIVVFFVMNGTSKAKKPSAVAVAIDAAVVAVEPDSVVETERVDAALADDRASVLKLQCASALDAKRWGDLIACSEELQSLDKPQGEKFYTIAHAEQRAEASLRALDIAVSDGDVERAKDALDAISVDSVYRKEADVMFAKANAKALALVKDARASGKEPKSPCGSYDQIVRLASDAFSNGRASDALALYDAAYKCNKDSTILRYAFASACKSKNVSKARRFWKVMTQSAKDTMLSMCANNGIYQKDLDNP